MGKSIKFKDGKGYVYVYPYYPVGSIYLSVNNTNPSTYFDGTWELVAKGKTLVGVDTSDSDFNVAKKTGGEKTVTLKNEHIPNHYHEVIISQGVGGSGHGENAAYSCRWDWDGSTRYFSGVTSATGGGQAHNNMPPYFTCYIWLRTA